MKLPDNADIGTREDFAIEKFQLAAQFIKDAHALYLAESNSSAVNRAYYAVFRVVTAAQTLDNKRFSSHGQAIGDFNREFIHEKELFPAHYGAELHKIMRLRHESDYDDFATPTDAKTQEAISFAEEFFVSVRNYCEERMGREIDVKLDFEVEQGYARYPARMEEGTWDCFRGRCIDVSLFARYNKCMSERSATERQMFRWSHPHKGRGLPSASNLQRGVVPLLVTSGTQKQMEPFALLMLCIIRDLPIASKVILGLVVAFAAYLLGALTGVFEIQPLLSLIMALKM